MYLIDINMINGYMEGAYFEMDLMLIFFKNMKKMMSSKTFHEKI